MTRVITIRLEVPDEAEVRWEAEPVDGEPLPLPGWAPPVSQWGPVSRRDDSRGGLCPAHRIPWRTVPAGVSKKTGRPYAAFQACPEPGCDERPPDRSRRSA